ncbi:hypothetical protein OSTOST_18385 [Ostertagia ostertagi]
MAPPGMASDYVRPPSAFIGPNVVMPPPPSPKQKEIISWNTLSLMCLCSLAIFGIGVGRMLEGAKWAIGVELAYALLVMVAGLSGIYAVTKRRLCAGYSLILVWTPFSLFPTIPWAFTETAPATWINKREPLELDFGLSLVILIQVLLSLVICISGCRSAGVLCGMVEEVKLHRDLHSAFHEMDLPQKA